jgi:hypothetical protein
LTAAMSCPRHTVTMFTSGRLPIGCQALPSHRAMPRIGCVPIALNWPAITSEPFHQVSERMTPFTAGEPKPVAQEPLRRRTLLTGGSR